MLKFELNIDDVTKVVTLPTSLSEVSPEYLNEVSKNVIISDDYSLVALVYRESVANLVLTASQKRKDSSINVVPLFVRSGNTSAEYIKSIESGSKLIVASSDLALGHHVACPTNKITINEVIGNCLKDKMIYMKSKDFKDNCCFIEFKLIPNCNIHGCYKNAPTYDYNIVNTYGVVEVGGLA